MLNVDFIDSEYGYIATLLDTSSNGTYVNEERVGKNNSIPLKDRDIISLVIPGVKSAAFKSTSVAYVYMDRVCILRSVNSCLSYHMV